MDKIAVLIPCYNEEKTVAKVVRDFRTVLPEAVVYVYDNNSSDRTAQLAREAGAVVRHEYQQGKGNVIRRMRTRFFITRRIWSWETGFLLRILQKINGRSTILAIRWCAVRSTACSIQRSKIL